MAELRLISAAQTGDTDELKRALDAGADIHERDAHGWTPLNWAAGKGHASVVKFLLDSGADVSLTGRDGRTPLMIARAAGHSEAADLLKQAEQNLGIWKDPRAERPYCRAYKLSDLMTFQQFSEIEIPNAVKDADADKIVYLHHDLTVTSSMWHGESLIVGTITPAWQDFCESKLRFEIPADVV